MEEQEKIFLFCVIIILVIIFFAFLYLATVSPLHHAYNLTLELH